MDGPLKKRKLTFESELGKNHTYPAQCPRCAQRSASINLRYSNLPDSISRLTY